MPGLPDEHIHEHATGVALKTVDAHKEPQDLVFYAGCQWVSISDYNFPGAFVLTDPYCL